MSSPRAPHPAAQLVRDPDPLVASLYAAGQYDDALARVETLLGATGGEPAVEGRLRAWRALLLRVMGKPEAGLSEARSLAQDAGLAGDLPLHFEALRVQASCLDARGEHSEAMRLCELAVEGLSRAGDTIGQAHARRLGTAILVHLGNSELALLEGARACALYGDLEAWDHLTGTLLQRADCLQDLGRSREAEALLEEALIHSHKVESPFVRARVHQVLARQRMFQGRHLEALPDAQAAVQVWETLGYLDGQVISWLLVAECMKALGRKAEARRALESAARATPGGMHARLVATNMAFLAVEERRFAEAMAHLSPWRELTSGPLYLGACLIELAVAAGRGQLDHTRRAAARLRTAWLEVPARDPDYARLAELAARECARHGGMAWRRLEAQAWGQALEQWSSAGATDRADACRKQLVDLVSDGVPVQVDALDLEATLGSGAVGEVWRAREPTTRATLAVKVIHARKAPSRGAAASVAREARAAARLQHPHIVQVHAHGLVDLAAEAMSGGRLRAGSPYLVMDLVDGGPMGPHCGRLPWPELRTILDQLLQALAHAHAHGVIHRDLKPDNVLVQRGEDRLWTTRLTDFGVARALGEVEKAAVVGTPAYMAPEQARADLQWVGPWTDLYAFGGLAWAGCCGSPPFHHHDARALLALQLEAPLPDFAPVVDVPDGLLPWLEALLHKDPAERLQRAADALSWLRSLGEAQPGSRHQAQASTASTSTIATVFFDGPSLPEAPSHARDGSIVSPGVRSGLLSSLPFRTQALTWQPPLETWTPAPAGAALQTFGLRTGVVVGREAEQIALWELLTPEGPRVGVVRGAAGVGKSRLIQWLCRSTHATGSAVPVRVEGGDLMEALSAALRWSELEPPALWLTLGRALPRADAATCAALVELLRPGTSGISPPSERERARLILELAAVLSDGRPVLLGVEGSGEDPFLLALAEAARTGDGRVRLLVELARDLPRERSEQAEMESLLGRDGVLRVDLGPLDDEALRAVILQQLPLEGPLCEQLVGRCGGNPQLALQTLGSWQERRLLALGPDGVRLRHGAPVEPPKDLGEAWAQRVSVLMSGATPSDRAALELLGVLGARVPAALGQAALEEAGVTLSDAMVARLDASGLMTMGEDSWQMSHGLLATALRDEAERAGHLAARHEACARACALIEAAPGLLGRHLLGAGRAAEATVALTEGATAAIQQGAPLTALRDLRLAQDALWASQIPSEDEAWDRWRLLRASAHSLLGRLDDAHADADAVVNRARGRGDARLLAEALRRRGLVARTQGRLESAEHDLREAAALLAEGGSPSLRTQTLHGLALALRSRGRIPEALALLEEARELAAAHGLDNDLCSLRLAMGGIAIQTGDTASASRELSAVLALSERTARRVDRAMALNGLAELQRKAGELAEAARLYREALALFEATGMTQAVFPRLNLGLIHLARGEWDQATDALRAALADLERQGRVGLAGATHGMLLAPSIARGELADAAHHLQEARARLDRTGFAEPDLIWSLELAVSQARELGATTLAVSVEHLLERQRAQLRGT